MDRYSRGFRQRPQGRLAGNPFFYDPRYEPWGQFLAGAEAEPAERRSTVESVFASEPEPNGHQVQPLEPREETTAAPPDNIDWKARALALQAEMDNFRKRQARRADEAGAAEKERLLSLILPVADNLNRALNHSDQPDDTLRQGVDLTRRELLRLLEAEGLTRLPTVGEPFNPNWHEAVATISSAAEPDTIVEEVEAGYLLGDKLLRPARVVVAA